MKNQGVLEADLQQKYVSKAGRKAVVLRLWVFWVGLSTLVFGDSLFAFYAPGCVTVPEVQSSLYGGNAVKFFEGRLALINARKSSEKLDAIVAAYRVACTESNRSVIWLSFTIPPELDSSTLYLMPNVSFVLQNVNQITASLSREPGGALPVMGPLPPVIGNSDENLGTISSKNRGMTTTLFFFEKNNFRFEFSVGSNGTGFGQGLAAFDIVFFNSTEK